MSKLAKPKRQPKAKGVNGRRKGKTAERAVAKLFEAWWGGVEPGCKFKSTPQSGGWSSPDVRAAFKTAGDLVTTAASFPFTVEVKHREQWSEARLRSGRRSPVWAWWRQVQKAANEQGGIPMLWFKKNRGDWFVIIPEKDALRVTTAKPEILWQDIPPGIVVKLWPICYRAVDILREDAVTLSKRVAP